MRNWNIPMTGQFQRWHEGRSDEARETILRCVYLLEHEGPSLGRPHADTLKGSAIPNLKELRARSAGLEYRILYRFNRNREAVLLVGDDKKGTGDREFYRRLIKRAEAIAAEIEAETRPARKERDRGDHQERGQGYGAHPSSRAGGTRPFRGGVADPADPAR